MIVFEQIRNYSLWSLLAKMLDVYIDSLPKGVDKSVCVCVSVYF